MTFEKAPASATADFEVNVIGLRVKIFGRITPAAAQVAGRGAVASSAILLALLFANAQLQSQKSCGCGVPLLPLAQIQKSLYP